MRRRRLVDKPMGVGCLGVEDLLSVLVEAGLGRRVWPAGGRITRKPEASPSQRFVDVIAKQCEDEFGLSMKWLLAT